MSWSKVKLLINKLILFSIPRTPCCLKFLKLCQRILQQGELCSKYNGDINNEVVNLMNGNLISNGNAALNGSSYCERRKIGAFQVKEFSYKIIDDVLEKIEV